MLLIASLLLAVAPVSGQNEQPAAPAPKVAPQAFESFTGKITKNRVRLRLKPTTDAPIIKELDKDDLVIVTSIVDDFYAVLPEPAMKGYIFRTYVLDGQIVGNHVHLRLEPDTTSPILHIFNEGDKVKTTLAASNNKWLEVTLPDTLRFYVAKEYVSHAGSPNLYHELLQKKKASESELREIEKAYEEEIKKPVDQIRLQALISRLNDLITKNEDAPSIIEKSKALVQKIQEGYFKKNLLSPQPTEKPQPQKEEKAPAMSTKVEEKASPTAVPATALPILPFLTREEALVQEALTTRGFKNADAFYHDAEAAATMLVGIVKSCPQPHKNIPGDYMLVNAKTMLPECYIYSTKVDLHELLGKEVHLYGSERPNNNFAYKAYFILKAE